MTMTNDEGKQQAPTNAFALKMTARPRHLHLRDALLCFRQVKINCASAWLFTVNPYARRPWCIQVHL